MQTRTGISDPQKTGLNAKGPLIKWLAQNRALIEEVVTDMFRPLLGALRSMFWSNGPACRWLRTWVRRSPRAYTRHDNLSELLANAGILPMFGFPTRQRSLFFKTPRDNDGISDATLADRPLSHAVSAFRARNRGCQRRDNLYCCRIRRLGAQTTEAPSLTTLWGSRYT